MLVKGSPAHAGIDPFEDDSLTPAERFPRTRGDRPQSKPTARWYVAVPPAHAGIDPLAPCPLGFRQRFPRTRGDRPPADIYQVLRSMVPPHTRG